MPFLLDNDPSTSELSDAVNYLLSNFNTTVSSDANTGEVKGPTGAILGYLYKYMAVKYADSFDGSVNFSNSPSGRAYFGIRNSNDAAESSNYTDYVWNKVTGGFGTTKSLWYITTGGRQIQFAVSVAAPSTGWLIDPGASIDLDVVTSGTTTTIAQSFVSYFAPSVLQVPRTGSVLTPVFTGIQPALYATNSGVIVPFTDAQTDSAAGFVNNSWRIGNSSTTGNGDISYTNITIGSPTDAGDYALWPIPTAMPTSPAYISVPIRFKNSTGVVTQASVSSIQLVYSDPGTNGTSGTRTAVLDLYQWASTPPTTYPSGTSTYTWATAQFTNPATLNGWTQTPGSGSAGQTLYNINQIYADTGSSATSPVSWTATTYITIGTYGSNGINGARTAVLEVYQWAATAPTTFPSGTSTYTWATGVFTSPANLNGWSLLPGAAVTGYTLWACETTFSDNNTTATSSITWSASTSYAIGAAGTNGTNGTRTAVLDLYQWSSTAPTTYPSGTSTYTWATAQFTNPATLNGWTQTPGSGSAGQTLFNINQIYADNGTSSTSAVTWSASTYIIVGAYGLNGINGARTAVLEVYQWAASAPTVFPSGSSVYTWATGVFTSPANLNGWSLLPGATTPGYTLWACETTYSDNNTTSTSTITWTASTTYAIGVAGANGTNGTNGTNGANGTRTALLPLYQWSSTVPTTYPSGTSTYTWATAQFTNPATLNSWTQTPSSGSPGQNLYEVVQIYTDQLTSATSSVTWSASTNSLIGGYGGNGSRTAVLRLYQWASSGPTLFPSGTSTYTWATSGFTNPATLNGWTQTPSTGATGQSLYQTAQIFVDSLTTATSTVTWSASTSIIVGSAGTTGATGATGTSGNSAVRAYAIYSGNPTVTGAAVVKSGATLPATTDFSPTSATAFTSTVQTPGSAQAMFQSDGIYNAVANTTTWNTPYLSNLKVANLSAITADMGTITAGNITLDTSGFIRGGQTAYATGNGFFLGYSSTDYKFSIGTSTSYLTFDGTNLTLGGNINTTGYAVVSGNYTSGSYSAAGHFNGSGTAPNGLVAYSGTSGTGLYGISSGSGTGLNASSITGTGATISSISGQALTVSNISNSVATGYFYNSLAGNALQVISGLGTPLSLTGSTSVAPMLVNSSVVVTNLNAERWNGIQAVTTVNNGSSGSLPTAYPPVTLTYNVLKYIQVNIGGVTGYIPIYI